MENLLKTERKPETVEIFQLLDEMTTEEQREMMVFIQGVKFAKLSNRKSGMETSSA